MSEKPYGWIDDAMPAVVWPRPTRRYTVSALTDPLVPRVLDSTEVPVPAEDTPCAWQPDHWFPERSSFIVSLQIAREGCLRCWMRPECADYGLAHPEVEGVWGGLTQKQRTEHKKRGRMSA